MKSDKNGCSTCPAGQESYEEFAHPWRRGARLVQYDYRHTNGKLFSIVRPTLEECRKVRDGWLANNMND